MACNCALSKTVGEFKSREAAYGPEAVKKAPKQKYAPKAKAVTQFTVTHPTGTSKPLTPGMDLVITVTGVTGAAKGTVELFSDPQKTKKIDQFGFTLKKNQLKSHFVSGENHVVWARVWVYKGAFKVKLDQSPNAKPVPAPEKQAIAAKPAPPPEANPAAATLSGTGQSKPSNGLILNGEAPLMPGAKVIKEIAYGMNGTPTMELKNIRTGPVDAALFKIPPGYTKAGGGSGSADRNAKKPARAKKPLSTSVLIKPTSTHAVGLEPDRFITITATGEDAGGALSTAGMKVLSKDKSAILSEQVTLKKGETQTWAVPAEKLPYDLYLSGGKGQVRFTVEQRTAAPAGGSKALPAAAAAIAKPASAVPSKVSGNNVFILDASGSMWGQVDGTAKIAIAKEVLTGLIRELPDAAVVGLVAYGHRRKGDCDDVEELVALGPLDKETLVGRIQALSPKDKTPISRSVRLTADRLKGLEDETTIILVSDGKETCDPDPCDPDPLRAGQRTQGGRHQVCHACHRV